MNQKKIDIVFNFLNSKKTPQNFTNIYEHLISVLKKEDPNLKLTTATKDNIIARLYGDIVMDDRFFLNNQGLWTLRDLTPYSEINKNNVNKEAFISTEKFNHRQMLELERKEETITNEDLIKEVVKEVDQSLSKDKLEDQSPDDINENNYPEEDVNYNKNNVEEENITNFEDELIN